MKLLVSALALGTGLFIAQKTVLITGDKSLQKDPQSKKMDSTPANVSQSYVIPKQLPQISEFSES